MDYRRLGRTDLTLSTLSIGTMTFGERHTEEEGHAQLDLAFEHGINTIDTAELYPVPRKAETLRRTEEIVGRWIKQRGNRDKCILATKVVGRSEATWFRSSGKIARLTRADIFEACERSLRTLQTDYIDLYQVHWPDRHVSGFGANPLIYRHPPTAADEVPIEETLSALTELVKAGKVREIGLSNESAWGTMRYLTLSETKGLARIASIQNAYSLINRTYETALAEISMREDVGLFLYSAMAWGYLSGQYQTGSVPPQSRRALMGDNPRYEKPGCRPAIDGYLKIAEKYGLHPAHMAISFAASRCFSTSVILGCGSLDQLSHALIALDKAPMTAELEREIDEVQMRHGNPVA